MARKSTEEKIGLILKRLKRKYRNETQTSLSHSSSWELLVATILSAQCTDAQVDKATPKLFRRFPSVRSYVNLRPTQLYPYVGSLGFYRQKSKNIIKTAKAIVQNFNSKVPSTMDELLTLPGVGRKTANVVLANSFGKNVGIAIDTHCITVANRLFLYRTDNPEKIEERLMRITPRKDWRHISHLFIALGRDVCTARTKYCSQCVLRDICPSSDAK